jgi:short-subunit dehydrogenase
MKNVIIIGATSGIGMELAKVYAKKDCRVGITGRRVEKLEKLKSEKPESYYIKSFDIRNIDVIPQKLEELKNDLGAVDLFIISSGCGDINESLDFDIENNTINTNVSGFTCAAGWAFNYFSRQRSGHLVAISSIGGLRGSRESPAYNASKAYQINYMEGLRQKAKKLKMPVYITDIRPGLVDTAMAKGDGLFWVMPLDKATKQIFNGIRKRKKVVYVTKRWGLLARVLKILPRYVYDSM